MGIHDEIRAVLEKHRDKPLKDKMIATRNKLLQLFKQDYNIQPWFDERGNIYVLNFYVGGVYQTDRGLDIRGVGFLGLIRGIQTPAENYRFN